MMAPGNGPPTALNNVTPPKNANRPNTHMTVCFLCSLQVPIMQVPILQCR